VTRRLRRAAALLALPLLLGLALWAPIPKVGDPGIDRVVAQVHTRLPGWHVVRATDTWEGGYAVVASCGMHEMGFQVVPGHGLPPDDAWLQPNDSYARISLEKVSDYPTFLIWRARPAIDRTLNCNGGLTQVVSVNARNASVVDYGQRAVDESRHKRID
jgi:hypothetical protein